MSDNNSNSGTMVDEEEDYMSGAILEQATAFEKKNREKTYSERRRDQLREQKQKAYIKPRKQLEQEAREKGLQEKIANDNKGMKMMMKMGFKQGSSLGKKNQPGIQEPIAVQLKQDRVGLGMDTLLKRKREKQEQDELERRKKLETDPEQYREWMAEKAKEGKRMRQVTAAAYMCERMDTDNDVARNILWTLIPTKENDEDNETPIDESADNVKEESKVQLEGIEEIYPKEEVDALKSMPLDDQLNKLVSYLRSQYNYCFWCAAQYDNETDLESNCPGLTEEEH